MQEIESPSASSTRSSRQPVNGPLSPRYLLLYLVLLAVILLAVLPPLLNVNRFKRRIVTSISSSLGRPVHLDSVTLVLLPIPGFKLENFVVAEDPAFGTEPVIHANNVQATLRIASLWRKRVEFSKISLQEPSINLVHNAEGAWNIEGILLQAARMPVAPTAQAQAGSDPRFPYIEASDARVNIKSGLEKLPLSFTEADFALWLPNPKQWRVRMVARPTRTDTGSSDTGTVSLEGTLGRAERLALIPIDLAAAWRNVPLGEASLILRGHDAGIRGDLRLDLSLHGTVGSSLLKTTVAMRGVRRSGFVPDHPLDLRAECQATTDAMFHAFHEIRCSLPPPGDPAVLALTGDLPDIHNLASASFELGTPGLPASVLLNWLRVSSPRIPAGVVATGMLDGSVSTEQPTGSSEAAGARAYGSAEATSGFDALPLTGRMNVSKLSIQGGPLGDNPVAFPDLAIATPQPVVLQNATDRRRGKNAVAPLPSGEFMWPPTPVPLGGKDPAIIEGSFDRSGYRLHLYGSVLSSRLMALAAAVPQFGDGLAPLLPVQTTPPPATKEQPIHIDIVSARTWQGGQAWSRALTQPARGATRRRRLSSGQSKSRP